MKKYIVFEFGEYSAHGGMDDIIGSFDTLEDAEKFVTSDGSTCYQIVDRDTWYMVWEN